MKTQIYIVLIFTLILDEVAAQQELLFSNDRYNILSFNPSIAGAFEETETIALANISYRNQWLGYEGAPKTINGSFDFILKDANIGLGLTLFNDRIGADSKFEIAGNYAYQIKTRDGIIAGGIRTAFTQIYSDFNKIKNVDSGDIYDSSEERISIFSAGLGFMYMEEDIKFGVSIPNLATFSNSNRNNNFKVRHLYVNASFRLGDYTDDFRVEPSILFKVEKSVPLQAKIGVFAHINNSFVPGIHYRTDDAVALSLGTLLYGQFEMALAYDITLSQIRTVSNNTLELFLGYRFK